MASEDTLLEILPKEFDPPASNFATVDTRNNRPCLDFDAATNETAYVEKIMPRHYAGTTGITVYIHYSMSSAVSNTVDWDIAFERIGDQQQDIDSDGFAAVNSVDNTTVPGTSGFVDIVNIPFTDGAEIDNIAVGEKFRVKITRDAVNDDAAGDAELQGIELKET